MFALRTTIVWLHVLAGAGWAAAAAAFVIVAAAIASEGAPAPALACRAALTINRVGAIALATLALTGLLNLFFVAEARNYHLSDGFLAVLAAKAAILALMAGALAAAFRAGQALARPIGRQEERALTRLMRLNGAIAGLGAAALGLGLWLTGS